MNCTICGYRSLFQQQSYAICGACFLGARSLFTFIDNEKGSDILQINSSGSSAIFSLSPPIAKQNMGFGDVLKWVKEMKDTMEELNGNIRFTGGFVAAFKEQVQADILVRPASNGPSIPAHKAVLATRSDIFKNMLDSNKCEAPAGETITLEELNHEELEAFIEFLYTGDLPESKMEKHVYSLFVAADKYEIAFLQKLCEHHMLGSIGLSNVLDILEIADTCSNQALKEAAMNFIVKNMESVTSSQRFEEFAVKNQHLHVKITRAHVGDIKNRSGTSTSKDHIQWSVQQDLETAPHNRSASAFTFNTIELLNAHPVPIFGANHHPETPQPVSIFGANPHQETPSKKMNTFKCRRNKKR